MVSSYRILGAPRALARSYGLATLVATAALLAGCGQKGPLYIAKPPPIPASSNLPAPPPAIAPAAPLNPLPAPAASAPR